jgi:DNA-directed RNA polymerase subunit RPC12/RpoP
MTSSANPSSEIDAKRKALGVWCPRCQSRKVIEGQLGEASRFYPARPLFKALTGKPVTLSTELAYACARCGLAWSEVSPDDLQSNIRKYGLKPHSPDVMRLVDGERTGALDVGTPPMPSNKRNT